MYKYMYLYFFLQISTMKSLEERNAPKKPIVYKRQKL